MDPFEKGELEQPIDQSKEAEAQAEEQKVLTETHAEVGEHLDSVVTSIIEGLGLSEEDISKLKDTIESGEAGDIPTVIEQIQNGKTVEEALEDGRRSAIEKKTHKAAHERLKGINNPNNIEERKTVGLINFYSSVMLTYHIPINGDIEGIVKGGILLTDVIDDLQGKFLNANTAERILDSDIVNVSKFFYDALKEKDLNIDFNGGIQLGDGIVNSLDDYIYDDRLIQRIKNNQGKIYLNDLDEFGISEVKSWVALKLEQHFWTSVWCDTDTFNKYKESRVITTEAISKEINENHELQSLLKSYQSIRGGTTPTDTLKTFLKRGGWEVAGETIDTRKIYGDNRGGKYRVSGIIDLWKERNRRINQSLSANVSKDNLDSVVVNKGLTGESMGGQMAREAGLGEQLSDKYDEDKNIEISDDEKKQIQKESLPIAWSNFVQNNSEISEYINGLDGIYKLYDFEHNTINESKWEILSKKLVDDFGDEVDVDRIHSILLTFPDEMNNIMNQISENYLSEKGKVYDETKLDAIGGVIDNIQGIFEGLKLSPLSEGFKYDEQEPVKIESVEIEGKLVDALVIKGTLNGTKTKICYDLEGGDLYMNSFIKESINPPFITVGDRRDSSDNYPKSDMKIGSIGSFKDIISDVEISTETQEEEKEEYNRDGRDNIMNIPPRGNNNIAQNPKQNERGKPSFWDKIIRRRPPFGLNNGMRSYPRPIAGNKPGNSDIFNIHGNDIKIDKLKFQSKLDNTIDLIGTKVKEYSEQQAQKNDIVINFLKTFNIIPEQGDMKSMQFNGGSNLYDMFHVIENSDSNQLNEFLIFMDTLSKYGGLTWGQNNNPNGYKNKMLKEITEANENDKDSARGILKSSLSNFETESSKLGNHNILSFGSEDQLSMAKLVIDNTIDNPKDTANSKLNVSKINNFLISLKNGTKINAYSEDDPESILKKLDNV